jgi:spore coat polysaccharide biosynthesis protein SpsF
LILAILQARLSSTRLPGKVLLPLAGKPMLERQIERLLRAERVDQLILATSDQGEDEALVRLAETAGIASYRGSLDDVLDRFYRAAEPLAPSHVVRLTGDCPVADPSVIDACIALALEGGYDYASNTLRPTWPDGVDVEVVTFAALRTAWKEAATIVEREHVMPFITRRPDRFRLGSLENDVDLSTLRWTVDEPADYEFIRRIYDALYTSNPAFGTADILALLAREPDLMSVNAGFERNEGLRRAEEALLKVSTEK